MQVHAHIEYGLWTERFVVWLLGEDHHRNVCASPRHNDRSEPSLFSWKKSHSRGSRLSPTQKGNPNRHDTHTNQPEKLSWLSKDRFVMFTTDGDESGKFFTMTLAKKHFDCQTVFLSHSCRMVAGNQRTSFCVFDTRADASHSLFHKKRSHKMSTFETVQSACETAFALSFNDQVVKPFQ